ncbi:MAG: trypsin-like peptidase domain-containing protein [Muribaculaceae bacterium]|nr:trypsin-like peptidase domain-containing protein [Muribaculaceae bacterium]
MKRRIGSMLLALMLTVLWVLPVCASEFNQETLESIVYVEEDIVLDGEYIGAARGTGFFVGQKGEDPQYIVTNYHVIEDFVYVGGGQSGSQSRLYVAFDQNDVEEAYVVEYNDKMDVALLRLAKATSKRKPLTVEGTYNVGSQVYAVGFPGLSDEVINSTSNLSIEDASVTSGTINRIITESGTGRRLIQMDTPIFGGNSGGPLVNANGNVIGINTMGAAESENMNYAVSMEEVIPLLDRNNVAYDYVDDSSKEVVPDDPDPVPIPDDPDPDPVPGKNNSTIIIVAIVAGVIIAAGVVVFLVMKGKKRHPQSQPASMAQQPMQPQGKPVICSMAQQHGGMKVQLEGRQVQIGRDPSSCQLVYRDGTPGVSKLHCQISWDASRGEFVLMDMKSTYGTFLRNGQKLNPGAAYYLRSGDSFYLGDRANEIRTELG